MSTRAEPKLTSDIGYCYTGPGRDGEPPIVLATTFDFDRDMAEQRLLVWARGHVTGKAGPLTAAGVAFWEGFPGDDRPTSDRIDWLLRKGFRLHEAVVEVKR